MSEQCEVDEFSTTWTEKEIRQQPQCWMQALAELEERRAEIDAFLAPVLALPDLKVILTGAGSSAFIGDMIAGWLSAQSKHNIVSIATTDLVTNPLDYLQAEQPTLLVSFARSGDSPESVAAVERVEQCVNNSFHLVITCNKEGSLCQKALISANAFTLLLPPQTHDRGFAMTSSITTMMVTALAVFAPAQINRLTFEDVADRCQQIIALQADFSEAVFGDLAYQRVIYLGSGGLQGTAREAALKVLELTAGKVAAFYDSPTGFRHGPKSLVDEHTLVVMFISTQAYTRKYDLDLLNELRRDGQAMQIVPIIAQPCPLVEAGPHICLPPAREFNDMEQMFCLLIYAQIFALSQSIKAGIQPDTPSSSGTVNRVVQGVTIHPWEQ